MSEIILPLRIYYEDTDAGGVVYHANYLRFMERARTELLLSLGYNAQNLPVFIVKNIAIEYISPAKLYDELEVVSRITELRGASIVFEQIIRLKSQPEKICCEGKVTVVCVNQNLRPCRIPRELAGKLHLLPR